MPRRPFTRNEQWLMPPTLGQMIPPDHIVRFVASFVDELDLQSLGLATPLRVRGAPAYHPAVLVAAWVYGFMTRIRSTRKLERAAHENIPMMWLLGGHQPDHSTLARFFKANRQQMKGLFKQTVEVAIGVGLVEFALHAIDGTRISTVSKDKTLGHRELTLLLQRAEETIAAFEDEAGQEGDKAGTEEAPRAMPAELSNALQLKEKIQVALAEVEKRERERRTHKKGALDPETGEPRGPRVHLADPEAVTMKGRGGYVVGYNGQNAVDGKAQVIVAADLVASATDNEQMVPMLQEIKDTAGRLAEETAFDGGFHSATNLEAVANESTEVYVPDPVMGRKGRSSPRWAYHKDHFEYDPDTDTYRCPEGKRLSFAYQDVQKRRGNRVIRVYQCHECLHCPHFGECTRDRSGRRIRIGPQDELLKRHRQKMRTEQAKAKMRLRTAVVEPVFAILREHLGLKRFLRRGLENARAEWLLLCAAYNLRKIWRLSWLPAMKAGKTPA